MQRQTPVLPQPLALNPLKDLPKVDEVHYSADFDNLYSKKDDFEKFSKNGKVSHSMLRYIPGLVKIGHQVRLYSTETIRTYADDTYKNKKVVELNVQLTNKEFIIQDDKRSSIRYFTTLESLIKRTIKLL